MKKEFDYHFAEMGEFFTTSWTAKTLEFKKTHTKEIDIELRLENKLSSPLEIIITEHDLINHPKSVVLEPKEVKHVILKIPCGKVKNVHKSNVILKSKNQAEKVPIYIEHVDK
jgi:hypothetical protein